MNRLTDREKQNRNEQGLQLVIAAFSLVLMTMFGCDSRKQATVQDQPGGVEPATAFLDTVHVPNMGYEEADEEGGETDDTIEDDYGGEPTYDPDMQREGEEITAWYDDPNTVGKRRPGSEDLSDEFQEDCGEPPIDEEAYEEDCAEEMMPPACEELLENFCQGFMEEVEEAMYSFVLPLHHAIDAELNGDCDLVLDKIDELRMSVSDEQIMQGLTIILLAGMEANDVDLVDAIHEVVRHMNYELKAMGLFEFLIPPLGSPPVSDDYVDPSFGNPESTDIPHLQVPPYWEL